MRRRQRSRRRSGLSWRGLRNRTRECRILNCEHASWFHGPKTAVHCVGQISKSRLLLSLPDDRSALLVGERSGQPCAGIAGVGTVRLRQIKENPTATPNRGCIRGAIAYLARQKKMSAIEPDAIDDDVHFCAVAV